MKIRENDDVLVISQRPVAMWLLGGFFVLIASLFIYGASGGYTNIAEMPPYARLVTIIFGSIGIFAGIYTIHTAPYVILKIDRRERTISLRKNGLLGGETFEFTFSEISGLRVTDDLDTDGDPVWTLVLELADGGTIPISSLSSPDEQFKRNFAFRGNTFIHNELPSAIDPEGSGLGS